ncbi:MAG: GNAT family N-acetyltransferase [Myxococcales bacterium]|nr:GNAT family N-acetyltransferase [Myxococcales bacterium]MDH3485614.1 GNAT family N-acetyltransferase [Myxococcales bacterium]
MSAPIEVREAAEADRETLLRFHQSLYQSHRDEVVPAYVLPLIEYRDYEQVVEDDVKALLSDRNTHILIAESEGVAVGYITGRAVAEPRRVLPRRGVVEDWYVDRGHRGQGIGAALLRKIEERFRSLGCEVIESGTWSSNQEARRAHDAMGFEEIRVVYRKRV